MQTNNGKFIISAPDDAKISLRKIYPQYDEVIDINMKAIKENITLFNVAYSIYEDCFGGFKGLKLHTKSLRCHLTVGKNKYDFTVNGQYNSFSGYLESIAAQFKL